MRIDLVSPLDLGFVHLVVPAGSCQGQMPRPPQAAPVRFPSAAPTEAEEGEARAMQRGWGLGSSPGHQLPYPLTSSLIGVSGWTGSELPVSGRTRF